MVHCLLVRLARHCLFLDSRCLRIEPNLAERVGFEPTVPFPGRVLSKHVDSATLAPLHGIFWLYLEGVHLTMQSCRQQVAGVYVPTTSFPRDDDLFEESLGQFVRAKDFLGKSWYS